MSTVHGLHLTTIPHLNELVLEILHLVSLSLFLLFVQLSRSLTNHQKLFRCFFVINLVLLIHLLNLLIPGNNVVHYNSLSVLRYICFPLHSSFVIEYFLRFNFIMFILEPHHFLIKIIILSLFDYSCKINGVQGFSKLLLGFHLLILKVLNMVFQLFLLHFFLFFNDFHLEFLGGILALYTVDCS